MSQKIYSATYCEGKSKSRIKWIKASNDQDAINQARSKGKNLAGLHDHTKDTKVDLNQ